MVSSFGGPWGLMCFHMHEIRADKAETGGSGYWTAEHMAKQFEDLVVKLGDLAAVDVVFRLDNSSNHHKMPADGLNPYNLNKVCRLMFAFHCNCAELWRYAIGTPAFTTCLLFLTQTPGRSRNGVETVMMPGFFNGRQQQMMETVTTEAGIITRTRGLVAILTERLGAEAVAELKTVDEMRQVLLSHDDFKGQMVYVYLGRYEHIVCCLVLQLQLQST